MPNKTKRITITCKA